MDKTLSKLAYFVTTAEVSHVSPKGVHECKRRVVDSLACAAGAFDERTCKRIRDFATSYGGTRSATIWGTGLKTSVEMAAFANGTMTRFLDYNDTFFGNSGGHPSDTIGGLLALAEAFEIDGAQFVLSIAISYELYCSFLDAAGPDAGGLDQAVAAVVGSAAGAANMLGLTESQTANAISLALAPNIHLYNVRRGMLSDWKGMAGPNAARNGIFAALLARSGFTGPTGPFEGQNGLFDLIGRFEWPALSLATPYIMRTHIKFYPVCYHGQSAMDALFHLVGKLTPDEIADIHVETYADAFQAMGNDPSRWAPANRETADHSLPYVVAIGLLEGRLVADAYSERQLNNPGLRPLMKKTRVSAVEEFTKAFPELLQTRITITGSNGKSYSHLQDYPRGHIRNPLSDSELEKKFLEMFLPWGNVQTARRCLEIIWSMDSLPRAGAIVKTLHGNS